FLVRYLSNARQIGTIIKHTDVKFIKDKQNTTTILPFLEKKVEHFEPPKHPSFKSSRVQKRQPVKKFVPELTVPRPFKFHAINRINKTENQLSTSPYIPLAARVKQFLEKTPDRFKSKLVSIKPATVQVKPPTKPKSPLLRTKLRSKPR
ncbi:1775_t:CDS:2, partial [Racocetra persica]